MAANSVFHDQLLAMGRADRIRRQVAGAVDVPLVFQALRHFSQWELARSSLFHHLIAEAISAREPERAARLMTEHVLQGRDALLERLAGRDAVGSDLSTARDAVPGQV
jgi:DNA-binding GntR family transcriptional regulator